MTRKTVKRIFIGTILFLILQYAAVGVVGYYYSEPWPAFVFPGFKSVHVFDDGFEVSRFEFHMMTAESDTVVVTPQVLFSEIPDSQLPGFLRTWFGHETENLTLTAEGQRWMEERAKKAAGFEPQQMNVVQFREFYSHQQQEARLDSVVIDKNVPIFLAGDR